MILGLIGFSPFFFKRDLTFDATEILVGLFFFWGN